MASAGLELPDDLEALRALALRQHEELDARDEKIEALGAEIQRLVEAVRLLRHQRFGHTSERVAP